MLLQTPAEILTCNICRVRHSVVGVISAYSIRTKSHFNSVEDTIKLYLKAGHV